MALINPIIEIVVIGGVGQTLVQMGGNGYAISMISPDNTPDYQAEVYDPDGFIVVPMVQITAQYARIDIPFSTRGNYLIKIHDAVDDGIYRGKPFYNVK